MRQSEEPVKLVRCGWKIWRKLKNGGSVLHHHLRRRPSGISEGFWTFFLAVSQQFVVSNVFSQRLFPWSSTKEGPPGRPAGDPGDRGLSEVTCSLIPILAERTSASSYRMIRLPSIICWDAMSGFSSSSCMEPITFGATTHLLLAGSLLQWQMPFLSLGFSIGALHPIGVIESMRVRTPGILAEWHRDHCKC